MSFIVLILLQYNSLYFSIIVALLSWDILKRMREEFLALIINAFVNLMSDVTYHHWSGIIQIAGRIRGGLYIKKLTEIQVYHNGIVSCTIEDISTFLIKIELIVIDFNDFYHGLAVFCVYKINCFFACHSLTIITEPQIKIMKETYYRP